MRTERNAKLWYGVPSGDSSYYRPGRHEMVRAGTLSTMLRIAADVPIWRDRLHRLGQSGWSIVPIIAAVMAAWMLAGTVAAFAP